MATIVMQRDLVVSLKKETILNVGILSKLQPTSAELSRLIFKENALEKPTQNLFNHLSYYLLSIIDVNVSASLTWPLYDTKAERAYRSELASFISDYSGKGLLSPVMSSYLVNPGCYKVTLLIFQLSQLAVNRMLLTKMEKENQKKLYKEMTEKYKSLQKDGFMEGIEKETQGMLSKFSNHLYKREAMEKIAGLFRKKITEMETKLSTTNAQNYINNLVDDFIKNHSIDTESKTELLKIKNIDEQSKFFDTWLAEVDTTMDSMEKVWDDKVSSLSQSCQAVYETSKALIAKNTGESDRSTYTVEYNHKNDEICTKDLENHVSSQQKYVLRNLVKDGHLNFPNLIRAFVISICYILKHNEIGNEIYTFNEYLEGGRRNYSEIVSAMRILIERVLNAEAKLQPSTVLYSSSISMKDLPEIPPLPNLSNLKATKDSTQVLFDTFTPFNLTKYQFNLRRKNSGIYFAKPQPKSLITPFHHAPRDDFLKSIISCRISAYDRQTSCEDNHNMSIISHVNRGNETIAECSSGFTKHQILRLLSTKKSSSSKKYKYSTERPNINIKKGGLFNESNTSSENGLFRSYSSPNLFENREKRCFTKGKGRKLSIMQEDSPSSMLEISGIATLHRESNYSTPQDHANVESSRKVSDSSMPVITIPSDAESRINHILKEELDLDKEMGINSIVSPILEEPRNSLERSEKLEVRNETPKTNTQLIRKTSSLEKIINRFKKVRANVLSEKEDTAEFKTIVEEKEIARGVNFDVFTANRILLPDLLSPSCNTMSIKSNASNTDYLDQICIDLDKVEVKKPRQSLGTALGVDQTFLDQFDLID
ncbi:uncharacterized protein [Epargyreus clarus]|uniref:uncharacterized protein n=1 Tax=Epargyreus clarus TaxID=520877 RepID=UPI003C2AC777